MPCRCTLSRANLAADLCYVLWLGVIAFFVVVKLRATSVASIWQWAIPVGTIVPALGGAVLKTGFLHRAWPLIVAHIALQLAIGGWYSVLLVFAGRPSQRLPLMFIFDTLCILMIGGAVICTVAFCQITRRRHEQVSQPLVAEEADMSIEDPANTVNHIYDEIPSRPPNVIERIVNRKRDPTWRREMGRNRSSEYASIRMLTRASGAYGAAPELPADIDDESHSSVGSDDQSFSGMHTPTFAETESEASLSEVVAASARVTKEKKKRRRFWRRRKKKTRK